MPKPNINCASFNLRLVPISQPPQPCEFWISGLDIKLIGPIEIFLAEHSTTDPTWIGMIVAPDKPSSKFRARVNCVLTQDEINALSFKDDDDIKEVSVTVKNSDGVSTKKKVDVIIDGP